MRLLAAIVGLLVSIPSPIFFGIGAQTFLRPAEKALAVGVTVLSGLLLLASLTLFFTPSVQRLQAPLLVACVAAITIIFASASK